MKNDRTVRVVTLARLHELCAELSGKWLTFRVTKETRSRVHVTRERLPVVGPWPERKISRVVAIFPCYPVGDEVRVTLDPMRIYGDAGSIYEGLAMFAPLLRTED